MVSRRKAMIVVSLVLFSLVFINLFAALATPPAVSAADGESAISPLFGAEMIRTIGGLNTPVGLGVMVVSAVFIMLGFGLWNERPWEVAAMFFLGADITLKIVNITAMLATGGAPADSLLALGVILVEMGLIGVLYRRYVANRTMNYATRA